MFFVRLMRRSAWRKNAVGKVGAGCNGGMTFSCGGSGPLIPGRAATSVTAWCNVLLNASMAGGGASGTCCAASIFLCARDAGGRWCGCAVPESVRRRPSGPGFWAGHRGERGRGGVPCGQCGALGTSRVRMPNSRHNAKRVTVCTVTLCRLAERERFELSIQVLPVYSLSRGAPSAARPPLRCRAARRARKRVYPVGGRAVKRVSHFRGAESVPGWRCHHSAPFVNGQPLHSLGRQTPFPLTNRKPSAISTARRQHAAGSRQPPVVSCGSRRCS